MSTLTLDLPADLEPDEATLLLSIKLVETDRISAVSRKNCNVIA